LIFYWNDSALKSLTPGPYYTPSLLSYLPIPSLLVSHEGLLLTPCTYYHYKDYVTQTKGAFWSPLCYIVEGDWCSGYS
jgi:hypothetical protein